MSEVQPGARLFIGGLDRRAVSKRDIRDLFAKYGPIVDEILLFKDYGFVQFERAEHCEAAIRGEHGRLLGTRPIGGCLRAARRGRSRLGGARPCGCA